MTEKPTLNAPVIVEGKYDKIKLESLVDGLIIPTDGFRVFKDKKMRALIRKLAETGPVAILTDSDKGGFLIRRHLIGILPPEKIVNVYIPDMPGKEKRKRTPSKEGKLGVEGIESVLILKALEEAGLLGENPAGQTGAITKMDLYEAGLSGGTGSRALREALAERLNLPARITAPALPALLSRLLTREAFFALCEELKQLSMDN
ncbi:MAG: DUF4093 domain-containing protein [Oscillospiraceae bacterium]|nr:DUF4093 domain-containing protein [Oscillospiraceae bacterium]